MDIREPQLRIALVTLGSVLLLLLTVVLAYQLVAARVPQQRAALEQLIRHETGLEVRFSELSVRWGWHGPEAVFHDVELGEPGAGSALLRAPRLIVGLDAWRIARSGELAAVRIRLLDPDIDLGRSGADRAAAAVHAPLQRAGALDAGRRILARWRGDSIDIEDGTLRVPRPAGDGTAILAIRYAQLRRLPGEWSADALLLPPGSQGGSLHISLKMHGDPQRPEAAAGAFAFEGQRLDFGAWHGLAQGLRLEPYLPQAGRGRPPPPAGVPRPRPHDARPPPGGGGGGPRAPPPATLELDAGVDAAEVRGRLQHAPLAPLAALAHELAPQVPLPELALAGEVREASFDWSAQRPPGMRLRVAAEVADLSLGSAARELTLSGLTAHVELADGSALAELGSPAARLVLTGESQLALDQLQVHARLRLAASAGGWHLSGEELQLRRAALTLAGSGTLEAQRPGAPLTVDAHLALRDADVALLAQAFGARTRATLGLAGQLTAGTIDSAELSWRGPWTGDFADLPGSRFTATATLRDAALASAGNWPDVHGIDARLEWRDARARAQIDRAVSGSFQLSAAHAAWDARGLSPLSFAGRLAGNAEEALGWIRDHPQLAAWARGIGSIDLRGATLVDLSVALAPDAGSRPGQLPHVRFAALLDGDELRPLTGLPPLAGLRGTLAFTDGHLQRSTLSGQWLGGPVSLVVGERREHGSTQLAISGRGLVAASAALQAAGGSVPHPPLEGRARRKGVPPPE